MKLIMVDIIENKRIARDTFSLALFGDFSGITIPGQFVNIALPGKFLRRPLSVCRLSGELLTLVYKVVGEGTRMLSLMGEGSALELLAGLGNGFDPKADCAAPLLIGGGAGVAPLYWLAEKLLENGKKPRAVLGFNTAEEIFMAAELSALGVPASVSTADGSAGVKGFVTDAMARLSGFDYVYACGPEPMLKAVHENCGAPGEYSFEARMACGFGACMGCSCETKYGHKRICRDGPVLKGEEIIW